MSSASGSGWTLQPAVTSRRWRVLLVWWITCVIWSSVFLFIKIGVTEVPPLGFATTRLALAAASLLLFIALNGKRWPSDRSDWVMMSSTGILLLGFNYGLLFWGSQYIPSGVTAVLGSSSPAFSLILASLLGSERMTPTRVAGVLLGLIGVGIVCLDQARLSGTWSLAGSLAVTGGSICISIAYVVVKRYHRAIDSTVLITAQMLSALLPLAAVAVAREGSPLAFYWTPMAIVALLYLTFAGSIVAMSLNYWLLRRMDATSVLSMGFVEPFIAVLLGAAVLDERIALRTIAGGLAVTVSVWLVLRRETSPP